MIPRHAIPRKFYRAAFQRLEDAEILFRSQRWHAAIYLAGYSVECMLKSLILAAIPVKDQPAREKLFRGIRGHDYRWLREQYRLEGGARFPATVTQAFLVLDIWDTHLRYEPTSGSILEATRFLKESRLVLTWAHERT